MREIEKIINSLKSKDSFGYDKIFTKILNTSSPFISSPLSYICNKSIRSAKFSSQIQICHSKTHIKERNKENVTNYRPISLLPSFSKVLKIIIYARLLKHFRTNNTLRPDLLALESLHQHKKLHTINRRFIECAE